jgi:hypothetical protein
MQVATFNLNPLAVVWDALEAHGCRPYGPPWQFASLCPNHEDSHPSLSVGVGADGRALIFCQAGCDTRNVIAALGLTWANLFPAGHRHARPLPGVGKPRAPVELVLAALAEHDIAWRPSALTRYQRPVDVGPFDERSPDMPPAEADWPEKTHRSYLYVAAGCPACRAGDRWPLWVLEDRRGRVTLSCLNGCDQVAVLGALAGVTP